MQCCSVKLFDRDEDFHDAFPRSPYLNMETGEILWAYEDDEDACMDIGVFPYENQAIRKQLRLHRTVI